MFGVGIVLNVHDEKTELLSNKVNLILSRIIEVFPERWLYL